MCYTIVWTYNQRQKMDCTPSKSDFSVQAVLFTGIVIQLMLAIQVSVAQETDCVRNCDCRGSQMNCSAKGISVLNVESLDLSKITSLDLSHNAIKALKHESLIRFLNLTYFNLSDNHISKIEQDFVRGLTKIIYLDLSQNHLTSIDERTFESIIDLNTLLLSNNYLNNLDFLKYWRGCNLVTLDISYNNIVKLEQELFDSCNKLFSVNLSHNDISSLSSNVFSNLFHLEVLDMSWNKLKEIPDKVFVACSTLWQVSFSHNEIQYLSPDTFSGTPGGECGNILANYSQHINNSSSSISYLDLSHNKIHSLTDTLFLPLCNLSYLNLEHNLISAIASKLQCMVNKLNLTVSLAQNPVNCSCLGSNCSCTVGVGRIYLGTEEINSTASSIHSSETVDVIIINAYPTSTSTSSISTSNTSPGLDSNTEPAKSYMAIVLICVIAVFITLIGGVFAVLYFKHKRKNLQIVKQLAVLQDLGAIKSLTLSQHKGEVTSLIQTRPVLDI